MNPKFKVGQRVKVKSFETIKNDIENEKYGDSAGLMYNMIFGKWSIIEDIHHTRGRHFSWYEDSQYRGFNYKLVDCPCNWWYGEDFLEIDLTEKITKLLKL